MKVHNMHYLGDCEGERANQCILDFSASPESEMCTVSETC